MAVKFHHQSFTSSSSTNPWLSTKPKRAIFFCKKVADLDHLLCEWNNSRRRCIMRHVMLENSNQGIRHRLGQFRILSPTFPKSRRTSHLFPLASTDDGLTVNGSPQASTSNDFEEMRVKLNQSLQEEDYNGLLQSLHDAARVFELAIKEENLLSKISWLSTAWLGVDQNAWLKALSYQASVYSLLQAAIEISSRVDGRDRDINIFVQRSLLRISAPLESVIRDQLSAKQPEINEWFWSEQVQLAIKSFVNYFERDPRFTAATSVSMKGMSLGSGNTSEISPLVLALTCIAAILNLGPAKISCSQFFSMIPDITGKLMDMMVEFIPIHHAYHSIKDIGLQREFLVHFGPRAAACKIKNAWGTEEVVFWVDLIQKQLQRAIDRERIWSKLTTSESIEVLERDLAIFGFFIALGRSTQSFLSANGYDVIDDPIEGFIRYLIGGSVLYYPQLSSISSYQLYVEVVCEELDWIHFYPGNIGSLKQAHGHKSKKDPPNAEAIPQVLDVCSYWMQSFIKYSTWLENPSNVKAARFLSKGHKQLMECMEELGILNYSFAYGREQGHLLLSENTLLTWCRNQMVEIKNKHLVERTESGTYSPIEKEPDSFDKALESVDEALIRLEKLLQELHVSNSNSGKEHLKAACSDLERIRKLKKEAEFLEASFRAKAASLQQGDDNGNSQSSIGGQGSYLKGKNRKNANVMLDRSNRGASNPRGLWSFLLSHSTRKPDPGSSSMDRAESESFEQTSASVSVAESESNEIQRFEILRKELIELEKRVQRSTDQSENEEYIKVTDDKAAYRGGDGITQLVQLQKKQNIIEKSLDKLKETSTDVWQGTQLLAIDVAAATGLIRRVLIGDELTEKEKKALQRTLTDLASVVPIGVLMLLPVTAVGHAAMLAAIQRYVPALIPSTYGPERLDLLRQLEKMKEMETSELNTEENVDELS